MRSTKLLAWFTAAALLAGCAPQQPPAASSETRPPAASSTPAVPEEPEKSGPAVAVDWSKLEEKAPPRPDLDGGRWYAEYTDHLITGPDYGDLLPYVGALAENFYTWTDDQGVEHTQPGWTTSMYGLMTREGKLVTDPVYQYAEIVGFRQGAGTTLLPVFALGQAREEWQEGNNGLRYAMAARDGSWVTDFDFWGYAAREDELMLYGPAGLTWLDAATGHRVDWSWAYLGVSEEDLPQLTMELQWLYGFNWMEEGIYLGGSPEAAEDPVRVFQPESAQVTELTAAEWKDALDRYYDSLMGWENWQMAQLERTITLTRGEEQYTLTLPLETDSVGYDVKEGLAAICDYHNAGTDSQAWLFDLTTGELLLEGREIHLATPREAFDGLGAVVVRQENGSTTVYGSDLTQLDTVTSLTDRWVYITAQEDWLAVQDGQTFYGCYDLTQGKYIFYRNLTLGE